MKKIVMMLLGVAATINVMAVTYTAKAIVTLTSTSGFSCELTLRQSNEYAALDGAELNMEGRKVALYVLNGAEKLQRAKAADFSDVKFGLMTDASTDYTITVSSVEGTETLYIWDKDTAAYALTEGKVYHFTAAAEATDEARFVIKKTPLPTAPEFCFRNEKLTVTGHNGKKLSISKKDGTEVVAEFTLGDEYEYNFQPATVEAGKYIIKFNGETAVNNDENVMKEYVIDVKPTVTPVP